MNPRIPEHIWSLMFQDSKMPPRDPTDDDDEDEEDEEDEDRDEEPAVVREPDGRVLRVHREQPRRHRVRRGAS
jgi:hypothetical protein